MKTLPIFSVSTGLAALISLANCEFKTTAQAPFSIEVAKGERVKLKAAPDRKNDPVTEFEKLLLRIAPADRKGTFVNLKREDGSEEEGPTVDDKFVPASSRIGPDGSMHHTQKIQVQNQTEFRTIIDSFDTGMPTPTPAP